jgi:superfamily II DNA/RNA helicase
MPKPLVDALSRQGVDAPFPIQSGTLPFSLSGRDVLGRGRTGSGKTYAFLLPLVAAVAGGRRTPKQPRALILAPTRELAGQIDTALAPLAAAMGLRSTTVFGGVSAARQISTLRQGVDIVVACPGRLEDLLGSRHLDLSKVEVTVLDEADHMADLGFLPAVRRLLDQTPRNGQRMLFSATLDSGVEVLVKRYLHDPVVHSVDSDRSPVDTMEHHVLHVDAAKRLPVILDLAAAPGRTVVFTRTKHGAKALARKLNAEGVSAVDLHGNLSQNQRTRNLAKFSDGTAGTLVATDIAARGIHVDDVTLVIHADPPVEHKAYLHRSGRTARAGASGAVVTIVLDHQRAEVRSLTRKAGVQASSTQVDKNHPLLRNIAPGERTYVPVEQRAAAETGTRTPGGGQQRKPRRQGGSSHRRGSGAARSGASRGGASRSGASGSGASHSAASFSGSRRGR